MFPGHMPIWFHRDMLFPAGFVSQPDMIDDYSPIDAESLGDWPYAKTMAGRKKGLGAKFGLSTLIEKRVKSPLNQGKSRLIKAKIKFFCVDVLVIERRPPSFSSQ
jgi:hypothetical protein